MHSRRRLSQRRPAIGLRIISIKLIVGDATRKALAAVIENQPVAEHRRAAAERYRQAGQAGPFFRRRIIHVLNGGIGRTLIGTAGSTGPERARGRCLTKLRARWPCP